MSTRFASETPIARKEDWRLALVTLRALFVAASQSVAKERKRPVRRDSAVCRLSDEAGDCNDTDSHASSGTTTATPCASSTTSASLKNGSSDDDSDGALDQVRQWHSVGGRVMNALCDETLYDEEDAVDTTGIPTTPSSLSPTSAPFDPSDNESDEATASVGRWHAVGGRLMNALRDDVLCEDEIDTEKKNWCSVKDRIACAFRRSETNHEAEDDSDDSFGQVRWKGVGSRLATVCRGCADEGECDAEGSQDASVGALLLLRLTHGIVGLRLVDWYAVGTRLAVSCHNYAHWTNGKVEPAAWQLLCSTVFGGRIHSSVVAMRNECDALCRGYTTMCHSFAAMGKDFDTPRAKEIDVPMVATFAC
eukprot:gnl/TRDRNA2_/TRDRNA2_85669_c0_seq2.p1 gnl/TRDRNA2_/TRDRNA2_85669_c0~~gnl/TRDRNA2_/TRDRNA2_85669_c0_seq2.p1  ORF type:complete len:364 (-),score=62.40 gnl/TRDRNA2_/TRDRNA2_85669_c0_seq2:275-1366(-)